MGKKILLTLRVSGGKELLWTSGNLTAWIYSVLDIIKAHKGFHCFIETLSSCISRTMRGLCKKQREDKDAKDQALSWNSNLDFGISAT